MAWLVELAAGDAVAAEFPRLKVAEALATPIFDS